MDLTYDLYEIPDKDLKARQLITPPLTPPGQRRTDAPSLRLTDRREP